MFTMVLLSDSEGALSCIGEQYISVVGCNVQWWAVECCGRLNDAVTGCTVLLWAVLCCDGL